MPRSFDGADGVTARHQRQPDVTHSPVTRTHPDAVSIPGGRYTRPASVTLAAKKWRYEKTTFHDVLPVDWKMLAQQRRTKGPEKSDPATDVQTFGAIDNR